MVIRTQATAAVLAAVVAAGLTAHGNPNSRPLWRDHIFRLGTGAVEWVEGQAAGLRARLGGESERRRLGPTFALLVSGCSVVGVDSEGCATSCGASFTGDLAAITGLAVGCDSIGERIAAPGVALGLSVVEAFNQSCDLAELLSEVNVGDLENPKAILCGGVTVEMGTGGYRRKIGRLRQVLLLAPELGFRPTHVDMRFGPQVVVEYEETKTHARKEV